MLTDQASPNPDSGSDADSGSARSRLDRLCDAFERLLKNEADPSIEDFLNRLPAAERPEAFPHLLGLEVDYREHAGENPNADEYLLRFPEFRAEIEELFRQQAAIDKSPKDSNSAPEDDTLARVPVPGAAPAQMGKYVLLKQCGRGGMGIVYKARHPLLRRPRALKLLRDHYDIDAADRFRQEMENAEVLVHPNIVLVHDAGEDHGRLFLVMEYVDGIDLQRLAKQHAPVPVGAACELIRQAALGLQHAHEHFLVHRDIKPSNLMLDVSGRVKILDFGLARFHAERDESHSRLTTQDGALLGTVDFMAPEQWRSAGSVTIQADLYSLGCTLFYMLTGRVPFPQEAESGSMLNTLIFKQKAHQTAPVPLVRDFRNDCPPKLQALLNRLMAKQPQNRPEFPVDVAHALEEFADEAALAPLIPPPSEGNPNSSQVGSNEPPRRPASAPSALPAPVEPAQDSSDVDTNSKGVTVVLPPPWQRSARRRFLGLVLLATVCLLAGVVGAWFAFAPDPVDEPGIVLSDAEQVKLTTEFGALPGLNGGWWFDETPWFTPAVRFELVRLIKEGQTEFGGVSLPELRTNLRDPNVIAVHSQLEPVAAAVANYLSPQDADDVQALRNQAELRVTFSVDELHDDMELLLPPEVRTSAVAELRTVLKTWPAPRLHLLAVILHSLSRTDTTYAAAAHEVYNLVRAAEDWKALSPSLQALLYADFARFQADRNQYPRSELSWDDAAAFDMGSIFQISRLCQHADLLRQWRSSQPELLTEAETMLKSAEALAQQTFPQTHPLRAEVWERQGWLALDRWQLAEAQQRFHEAADFRLYATKHLNNSFAYENWVFDQQGRAMALHFRGHDDASNEQGEGAIKIYLDLTGGIEEYVRDQSKPEGLKRERRDRLPNLYERLADCYLFGPTRDYAQAAANLEKAYVAARIQLFDSSATRWFHVPRLYYKRAIALQLGGMDPADESVAEMFTQAESLENRHAEAVADGRRYYESERRVAIALRHGDPQKQADELWKFLREIQSTTVNRRNLEIVLTAFRLYFESGEHPPAQAEEVARMLWKLTADAREAGKASQEMREAFLVPVFRRALQALRDIPPENSSEALRTLLDDLTNFTN